jgi:hypothetical protein
VEMRTRAVKDSTRHGLEGLAELIASRIKG